MGSEKLRIRNHGGMTEVFLYEVIGDEGVRAVDFIREIRSISTPDLHVRINSPGGEVYEAVAMYHALRAHDSQITVFVDGLAASAASVVAMAGDLIIMGRGTRMMIHEAWGNANGNATQMKQAVEILDVTSDSLAKFYANRAGGTPAEWRQRMKAETWYSAEEAVDIGLADRVARGDRRAPAPAMDMAAVYALAPRSLSRAVRDQVVVQLSAHIVAGALMSLHRLGAIRLAVTSR